MVEPILLALAVLLSETESSEPQPFRLHRNGDH